MPGRVCASNNVMGPGAVLVMVNSCVSPGFRITEFLSSFT